jgi:hypothetical protein
MSEKAYFDRSVRQLQQGLIKKWKNTDFALDIHG